jgi:hypothetical protein
MMICETPTVTLPRVSPQPSPSAQRGNFSLAELAPDQRADLVALTFRPGDRTATFNGKTFRPIGTAVGVVLTYDADGALTVGGFRGTETPAGDVRYGGAGREFQHRTDPTNSGGLRFQLPYGRNPSLVDLAIRMDKLCGRIGRNRLPRLPLLPRILLGFGKGDLPPYVATPGLRRLAAARLNVTLRHLAGNPPEWVERLLTDLWGELLADPTAFDPHSGLVIVDAELCAPAHRPLRVFEDFSDLIGDWTWNPARALHIPRLPNPAREILAKYGIDPKDGFEQPIPEVRLEAITAEFRETLGDFAASFDEEDVFDALVFPDEDAFACSQLLPHLRRRLKPFWNETTTDTDLRRAARYPQLALFASGACRVQVFRRSNDGSALRFGPAELRRRISVDWEPIEWPRNK